MIFSTKNKQFAILGNKINDIKTKLKNLSTVYEQYGLSGKNGAMASLFGSNQSQLIPEANLTKVLSFDEASRQLEDFNRLVIQGGMSLDTYFKLYQNGNTVLKKYVTTTEQQAQSTQGLIKASEGARAAQIAHNEAIRQSTLAFKAASIAKRIFATIGNMAAMFALSKIINVVTDIVSELIHSEENLQQTASDLGAELSNNSSDIAGYKMKIEELKSVINNSSSSFDEVSQARVDLMSIQDELIEKFGTEKGVIESITNAVNDQSDALDELSKKSYFQAKNKFNEKTGGNKIADWLSYGNTSDERIQSNMDNMVMSMQSSFYELETTGNEVLDNLIAKSYGLSIVDDMYGNGKHFQVYGNLYEIQDKLYGIQELSQNFDFSTGFENSFTKISNDVDDALSKYENLYNQYLLYEKILTDNPDNQYDEQFDLINKTKKAYNEAVKSGNEEDIKSYADEYAKTLQSAINLAMNNYDYDVAYYFKRMYPELQQMFGEWQFNTNFESNTDGLKDSIINTLDSIDGTLNGVVSFSTEDIINFNPNISMQEQVNAYGELINIAELYGLTIKQLITLLQAMGLIQSENYQQLVHTFGQDNIDKLSARDLELAYTIPNIDNISFEQLQTEIQKVKNTSAPPSPFPQAWSASFTSEDESVRELGNTLLELAEQGRLTIETFNNADSSDYFKNLGISADEAVSKINRMADESQQLSSMANQISSMSEALDTKQAEGFVSADVLSGFDAEVRGLESWDKFQMTLGSTTSSYEECQEAASALASEWIRNSDFLAQLTEENKEYYATQLEAMGIENYEEIISYAQSLNEAKEALAQASEMSGEATQDEIEALIAEGAYSELTAGLILQLYDAKIAEQALTLDTSADCERLIALAGDADKTSRSIQLLLQLKDIYNGFESGIYDDNRLLREEALAEVDRIKGELEELANGESENSITIPGVTLGSRGTSSAKSAGQSAGNAYVDAFEEELEDLKTLRDRGTITEKAYLDEFRRLYQKYYRDKKKYAEQYAKYEHEYLQGMKSLYESALSGITSMLDKQIDAYEDQKSAAVDSLEAERDARIDVLETQKEQYEEQIKLIDEQIEAKEKIIDGINEEIDAIKDANEQRKREIDLEKSKYELERMMNQRTILQYSADKGMHYTQDTDGARDAKQAVEDAELEIEIAGKEEQIKLVEKEIDLLEERKESINEQIDQLDVQIDQINKQYDQMIAETEQYWDSIIQGMEDYKSRWQELGEIEEQAKLIATLEQLGISTNDILNMSGEAFSRFKEEYFGLLADIYSGNDTMLSGLSVAAGTNVEALGSYLEATQQYIDGLNGLGEAIAPVSEAIGNVTSALTGGGGGDAQEADGADGTGTGGLVGAMNSLKDAADKALGSGSDGTSNPEGDGTGAIGKFRQLENAVTDVTAAIGGDAPEGAGIQEEGNEKNGEGLIDSITNLGETTEDILGEPDGEGVTGRFGQLSDVIGEAEKHVAGISDELTQIDGREVSCTIKVNVEMNGELPSVISGSVPAKITGGIHNFSNSKPAHDDTPHISSGLSSQSVEAAAVEPAAAHIMPAAESGLEIPAFSPETNHIAAENSMEPPLMQDNDSLLRPIGPGERAYELRKAFEPLLQKVDESFEYLSGNAMITHTRLIDKMVRDITAANMITNNRNIQPNIRIGDIRITCPGVTSREVAAQVGAELNRLFNGFHLYTEQQSAIR